MLRIECANIVTRPAQSPEDVAAAAIAGEAGVEVTFSQYVAVGADPAARPQHHAIASFTGPAAGLAKVLERLVPLDFAVVRQQSTAGVLSISEASAADDGTNITYSRLWSNANVSPTRSGALFKPNGPLATAKPNYGLLLSRLDKP